MSYRALGSSNSEQGNIQFVLQRPQGLRILLFYVL